MGRNEIFSPHFKNSKFAFQKFPNELEFRSKFGPEWNREPQFVPKSMRQFIAVQCMNAVMAVMGQNEIFALRSDWSEDVSLVEIFSHV